MVNTTPATANENNYDKKSKFIFHQIFEAFNFTGCSVNFWFISEIIVMYHALC